jgi:MFS family permease
MIGPAAATRGVWLARGSMALFGAGRSVVFAVLPIVFRQFGLSESWAGLVLATSSVAAIFAAPALGQMSDALGRRRLLAGSLAAYGLVTLTLGVALLHFAAVEMTPALVLFALVMVRAAAGAGGSGIFPACQGFLADSFEPRERRNETSRLSAASNLGLLVAALLVAALGALALPPETAIIAVGLATCGFALLVLGHFPTAPRMDADARQPQLSIVDPRIRIPVILCASFYTIQAIAQQFLGFLVQDRLELTGSNAAFWTGAGTAAAILASMLSQTLLMPRLASANVLPSALAIAGAGLVCAAFAGSGIGLALCLFVQGAAAGLVFPTLMGMASERVSRAEQGAAAGLMAAMPAAGMAIGPLFGGLGYTFLGPSLFAVAGLAMTGLSVVVFHPRRLLRS